MAAMKSPRDQEILSIEQTLPDMATADVRVRIGQTGFVDHLVFRRIDRKWLITAKAFHVAAVSRRIVMTATSTGSTTQANSIPLCSI
jgi:hypothetical protein